MKKNKAHPLINRLSIVALALPGLMQTATAGRVDETYTADFQYGNYGESNKRMSVDIFDGAISAPIGKSMTASVNLVRDVISGASPQYNKVDSKGNIKQIVSGQSGLGIHDQRDGVSTNLAYFFDKAALGLGGGFSRENDYTSRYINTNGSLDLNNKLTTLNFSGSWAFDIIEPTARLIAQPDGADYKYSENSSKTSQNYLLGVTQIIDKNSLVQSNVTFGYQTGYLSDPYKQVFFVGDGTHPDVRPQEKFQFAWLTRYVRHFEQLKSAALHADYRFYTDDWGINAHTLELSWNQPIGDGWQVVPRFRYYSQDQADFYQPFFNTNQLVGESQQANFYSSDYRLAGFGTLTGGIKVVKEFLKVKNLSHLQIQAGVEYNDHRSSYELGGNGNGSFNDFSYYLVTASVNVKF